jgi:hypothetical protein
MFSTDSHISASLDDSDRPKPPATITAEAADDQDRNPLNNTSAPTRSAVAKDSNGHSEPPNTTSDNSSSENSASAAGKSTPEERTETLLQPSQSTASSKDEAPRTRSGPDTSASTMGAPRLAPAGPYGAWPHGMGGEALIRAHAQAMAQAQPRPGPHSHAGALHAAHAAHRAFPDVSQHLDADHRWTGRPDGPAHPRPSIPRAGGGGGGGGEDFLDEPSGVGGGGMGGGGTVAAGGGEWDGEGGVQLCWNEFQRAFRGKGVSMLGLQNMYRAYKCGREIPGMERFPDVDLRRAEVRGWGGT